MTPTQILCFNLRQCVIALDQLANTLIGVVVALVCTVYRNKKAEQYYADETVSSHSWRWHVAQTVLWPRRIIDWVALMLGDKNHCQESYESERLGRQLPPEMRE